MDMGINNNVTRLGNQTFIFIFFGGFDTFEGRYFFGVVTSLLIGKL
uniref:Uncharacterized protein n=1 Tax=Candidozyma auris TaxID=498019 RepID=A0A0L0P5F5_CANAR